MTEKLTRAEWEKVFESEQRERAEERFREHQENLEKEAKINNALARIRHPGNMQPIYFKRFRQSGLSDETIAAGFNVPVEDVDHDIRLIEQADIFLKEYGEDTIEESYPPSEPPYLYF